MATDVRTIEDVAAAVSNLAWVIERALGRLLDAHGRRKLAEVQSLVRPPIPPWRRQASG
jgi:hypothetical protein